MTTRARIPLLNAAAIWLLALEPVLRAAETETITLPPLVVTATKPASPSLGMNLEISPAWTFIVLDEKGQPMPGLKVSQTWNYRGFAEEEQNAAKQNDAQVTDAQGKVSFPVRSLRVNPAKFAAARAANLAVSLLPHQSSGGPTASFHVDSPSGYKGAPGVSMTEDGKVWPDAPQVKTVKDKTGRTTTVTLQRSDIFEAIRRRDFVRVKELLATDPGSAKRANSAGDTLLHELMRLYFSPSRPATPNPFTPAVELAGLLIAAGADVNAKNQRGETPLHSHNLIVELATVVVANGADVNAKDRDGATPLHLAAAQLGGVEIMEFLLTKGADPKALTTDLSTPLHRATSERKSGKKIELLVQHGADVNAKNRDGNTPLHLAANNGAAVAVQTLLEMGADPTIHNAKKQTPAESVTHVTTKGLQDLETWKLEAIELLAHPPAVKTAKPAAETTPVQAERK